MRLLERKWWICGLLLLATMINYMDRQTLANAATRVTREFSMSQEKYGELEQWFGWSFGAGSLLFGLVADRMSVRWLYPFVLLGWSMAGIVTAWTTNYEQLFWCRVALGFFEAAHWPCAVKTTFAVLAPGERAMGNSILQSGASVGAMITPPLMLWLMTDEIGTWRHAFQAVGVAGLLWIGLWFLMVRGSDFESAEVTEAKANPAEPLTRVLTSGRFVAVALLIVGAQTCWALFRVWLPKFLQEGRGYSERAALGFNSVYFIATDVGCLLAGLLALWLVKNRNMSSHRAKRRVYQLCSLMTCSAALIPWLPQGFILLAVILVVGAGALGLFPCYYSFVQELSAGHVGFLTGLLSCWVWLVTSPLHTRFGALIDRTHSFDLGMASAGLAPLLGVVALAVFWKEEPTVKSA